MATDILVLNTAAADLRRNDFGFVEKLVGPGGLALCETADMPDYSQEQIREWTQQGCASAGGPGNTAPLIARCGLKTAVGVNLGGGDYGGLDAQGRFFYDALAASGVDMSQTHIHPELATGTSFIHDVPGGDRGGIGYFPGANDDFDFDIFKGVVEKLEPRVVYYMYSGLSRRGDANGGRDLADFIKWCRDRGIITIVDSHTLTTNPREVFTSGVPIPEYRLLEPLLPVVDVFFTSSDEAKMIINTLFAPRDWDAFDQQANNLHCLQCLTDRFWQKADATKLMGITVSDGAYEQHISASGDLSTPLKIASRFMDGEVLDLIGAGDSFRAGLITYIASNQEAFTDCTIDFAEAVQMGNLFASLYIKAPRSAKYSAFLPYEQMLNTLRGVN